MNAIYTMSVFACNNTICSLL